MARKKSALTARTADKYQLYQWSVQEPGAEPPLFTRMYRDAYGRSPLVLREDFCGTAAVSCAWVQSGPGRSAAGVDLSAEPLRWGQKHLLSTLTGSERERVKLVRGDVRTAQTPAADVVCAQNFSFYLFKTRQSLGEYLRTAYRHLKRHGVLILDMMGGSGCYDEGFEEKRRIQKKFIYVWEQSRFDPISNHCQFYIHFRFDDGSQLRRAFGYDWRLWSIPEVTELLRESGFRKTRIYWQKSDGLFVERQTARPDPAWIAYVVGIK